MFKVVNDYVIIKKTNIKENKINIIINKDFGKNIGVVVSVNDNSMINENDKIIFVEEKSYTFNYDNEEYLFVNSKDVIAILE